jgi:hypothetical protein
VTGVAAAVDPVAPAGAAMPMVLIKPATAKTNAQNLVNLFTCNPSLLST